MGDKNITLEEMRSRNAKALRALQGEPEPEPETRYFVGLGGRVGRSVAYTARQIYGEINSLLLRGYTLEQIKIEVGQ